MAEPDQPNWFGRLISRRGRKEGASAALGGGRDRDPWLIAIVVFGIAEHLIDPQSFDNVWLGMWWATQTVTTVGYGDVVPTTRPGD